MGAEGFPTLVLFDGEPSKFKLYGPLNYGTAARTLFLRPYLAHFCPVFSRFFAVFSVLKPGFQKVAPEDRGPVPQRSKTAAKRVVAAVLLRSGPYPPNRRRCCRTPGPVPRARPVGSRCSSRARSAGCGWAGYAPGPRRPERLCRSACTPTCTSLPLALQRGSPSVGAGEQISWIDAAHRGICGAWR